MRSTRGTAVVVCALAAAVAAQAQQWHPWEWDNLPGWTYNADGRTITVTQPGAYRFFCTLGDPNGPLADLQNLTAPGVNGTVTVSIIRAGGVHLPGCTALGQMDLAGATTSVIAELRVAGDAGTLGPIAFGTLQDGDTFHVGGNISDAVTISSLAGDITCGGLSDFTATVASSGAPVITVTTSDYAGTMVINLPAGAHPSVGGLHFASVSGSVTCHPYIATSGLQVSGDVSGAIDLVGDSYYGYSISGGGVNIGGSILQDALVQAEKAVNPHVYVQGDIAGGLEVAVISGDYQLRCFGNVTGTIDLNSHAISDQTSVQIDGDLLGTLLVEQTLQPNASGTRGHVRVLGAFGNSTTAGTITLQQGMDPNAYVCINYDGYGHNDHDTWDPNSYVHILTGWNAGNYSKPDDDMRVHYPNRSCGWGDFSGDQLVTFGDIDGFVTALGYDVNSMGYGRRAAAVFSGDLNCDGLVTFADIDPFVALIGTLDPCHYCGDGDALLEGGLQSRGVDFEGGLTNDPQSVADALGGNVSEANHAALVAAVDNLAAFPPAAPFTDWPEVAELLAGE
jgi:hypothetical protein